MRNKGFAYTADQKLARWDDIGGPRPFEKWALQGPWQFVASRVLTGLMGAAGAVVVGWLLGEVGRGMAMAGGFIFSWVLVAAVTGQRMWKRERGLHDGWLNRQGSSAPMAK